MLKCNDCGAVFDKPLIVHESRGEYWGVPCWEDMAYCPFCESEAIEDVYFEEEDNGTK